jgi:hypothetical protein
MRNKSIIIVLFLLSNYCLGQTSKRNSLHGKVVSDSISVENGYVFNLNSKASTFIGVNGFFDIFAMPKDTLLITSLAFKSKKMVLIAMDFKEEIYVVKLELFNNQLREVLVGSQIKPKIAGSQEIVDGKYFDDAQSSPLNRTMPYHGIENGFDFVRTGKLILSMFKKKNGEIHPVIPDEIFMDKMQRDFRVDFFINTLKLKADEINLFLMYCYSDVNSKIVLKTNDKFKIMDFLITKNQEFKVILKNENIPK